MVNPTHGSTQPMGQPMDNSGRVEHSRQEADSARDINSASGISIRPGVSAQLTVVSSRQTHCTRAETEGDGGWTDRPAAADWVADAEAVVIAMTNALLQCAGMRRWQRRR